MSDYPKTHAQSDWQKLGFGLFVHFGINTFTGQAWGDGKAGIELYNPTKLDCRQWVDLAVAAGMKYLVLTTKHHDGFCLWPSAHTDYSVKNATAGPLSRTDVVGACAEACRAAGIKFCVYYSLWDRNFKNYDDDQAYADYMKGQLTELLTHYGDVAEVWFDGGWDKEYPGKQWDDPASLDLAPRDPVLCGSRWRWKEIYAHVHQLQPDTLVVNNSSSHKPGIVRYHPVDVRTCEHYDFIYKEKLCRPFTDGTVVDPEGNTRYIPVEFTTTLTPDWFWSPRDYFLHPSACTIAGWRKTAAAAGANLLLNIGPNPEGLMPDYHREFLVEARRLFEAQSG